MLPRVERCLQRRLELGGCSLAEGLVAPPTKLGDWIEELLNSLLYGGHVGGSSSGAGSRSAAGAKGG